MKTNFRTIQSACLADWGPAIETTIRRIAVLVAFTYAAGFTLGTWIHRANDRLAAAYVAFLGLSEQPVAATTPEPVAQPMGDPGGFYQRSVVIPGKYNWVTDEQDAARAKASLCRLTVAELRKLARAQGIKQAGGRRIAQATKSALLEILN